MTVKRNAEKIIISQGAVTERNEGFVKEQTGNFRSENRNKMLFVVENRKGRYNVFLHNVQLPTERRCQESCKGDVTLQEV
jgi:hypothetical protein